MHFRLLIYPIALAVLGLVLSSFQTELPTEMPVGAEGLSTEVRDDETAVGDIGAESSDSLTSTEGSSRSAEGSSRSAEGSAGSSDTDVMTPQDEKQALIEGIGFSGAIEGNLGLAGKNKDTKLYCLNSEQQSPVTVTPAQACERISNRLASVSGNACVAAKLQPSQCNSVSGFPILYREFKPLEGRVPQGKILVIGGIHGDELTSVSIVFRWIEKLNKYHSGLFHWHIVPVMNPDGVLRRAAERTNKNGVDLNRNLPSNDWDQNALKYWHEKQGKNPRRYPGKEAASEPETQWLVDEINSFEPDAIISVHAPYGVVDFDSLLLNTAPRSLGKLTLNLLGTYPGSLGNYAGINRNIPVITLELPHAWVMPSELETAQIWEDIVTWLRKNVNTDLAQYSGE